MPARLQASGGSLVTLVIELAGYAASNEFGIYSYTNPANKVRVFGGAATTGKQALVSFGDNGDIYLNLGDTPVATNFGSAFGFYLNVYNNTPQLQHTFYSEDSLNPEGLAQALIFKGKGDSVKVGNWQSGSDANHYYVAFEDQNARTGDHDYQDFVAMVESIQPVPEPGSMLLLGTGLFGLAGVVRRRFTR